MVVRIPRLQCNDCGAIKQSCLAFADTKNHYMRALR
ncbi:MAG: hypothetical protein DRP65_09915 [Planctomycetota bacterium]|nr:MAG: hypothetical protein DRP65_09915 [Planctomycetota bacterium]